VKTQEAKAALTLGELIESCYHALGKRRAMGIIRLAAKAHVILLQEQGRTVIPKV